MLRVPRLSMGISGLLHFCTLSEYNKNKCQSHQWVNSKGAFAQGACVCTAQDMFTINSSRNNVRRKHSEIETPDCIYFC